MAHVIFDNDVIDVYFPLILKQYSLYSLSLLKKLLLQKTKLGIQCFKFSHSKYLNNHRHPKYYVVQLKTYSTRCTGWYIGSNSEIEIPFNNF